MAGSREGSSTSSSTSRPTWTFDTPVKPRAGRARSTVCPCGSRMPAFGRMRTRARTTGPLRRGPLEPAVEGLAGEALVGLEIELARARHHVVRDGGRRRRLVPARARRPVAHVLLVERRLRAPGRVPLGRPEAGGVRRAHLVAEDQGAVLVEAELELRVGEDDAVLARVAGDALVHGDGDVAQAFGEPAVADELDRPLEVDRLVMADLGLRRRRVQRLGQLL